VIRTVPTLADVLGDRQRIGDMEPEQARRLLIEISVIQPLLIARALAVGGTSGTTDRLLKIDEAATRMGQSPDWLYRHAGRLPFTVRQGRGVRFSERGLAAYIAQQANGRHAP
jgi:predicted DNA-binding transcriptional regulator AlpA